MDSVMAVFGRRLRALRKAKGLTQEQLGRAVGVDYKHLGRLERGEFGASFDTIQKLAEALGCDYYELFLPNRLVTDQLEGTLMAAVKEVEEVDRAALKQYLRDLLTATRKLQVAGRPGK